MAIENFFIAKFGTKLVSKEASQNNVKFIW